MTVGADVQSDVEHVLDARNRAVVSWYANWYAEKAARPFGPQPVWVSDHPWGFEDVADLHAHVAALFPLPINVVSEDGNLIYVADPRVSRGRRKQQMAVVAFDKMGAGQPGPHPKYCQGPLDGTPYRPTMECGEGCAEHRHLLPDVEAMYPYVIARCADCEQWFYRRELVYPIAVVHQWADVGWWTPSVRRLIERAEQVRAQASAASGR